MIGSTPGIALGARRCGSAIGLLLSIALTTGCAGLGPRVISAGRPAYNEAIQRTGNEEMLLNIVRLRYSDTPFFLRVSGVAANVSSQIGVDGGATLPSSGSAVGNVAATARLLDNPTVTFAPLQGDQFVTQMLTPVRLQTLLLLIESGWSIDRVLRLCVQRMNDVRNAPSASGPTPTGAPVYTDFRRASQLLGDLYRRDAIDFSIPVDDPHSLVMRFRAHESDSPEVHEVAKLLDLDPRAKQFRLSISGAGLRSGDEVAIETRSLMGSLFYLSQAVQPAAEHESKGWVTITRTPDGEPFDWSQVMDGLFRIESGPRASADAFLEASYLGHRFRIDQRDLQTKTTFELLNLLFALQAGATPGGGPVLTLPVSR